MTEAKTEQLGLCQVRSETDHPCTRRAVVEVYDMPFCGPCAREQEAYFAIGELETRARGPASGRELAELIAEAGGRPGHPCRSSPPYSVAGVYRT